MCYVLYLDLYTMVECIILRVCALDLIMNYVCFGLGYDMLIDCVRVFNILFYFIIIIKVEWINFWAKANHYLLGVQVSNSWKHGVYKTNLVVAMCVRTKKHG